MQKVGLAAICIALVATAAPAASVPPGIVSTAEVQDVARVDPSKTLALIRRIKDAGGETFAS
jgi:hypothetical protein